MPDHGWNQSPNTLEAELAIKLLQRYTKELDLYHHLLEPT